MSQRFTRSELHKLVWSKPTTELAKQFNLSDVAIHKICKKHDVPKPPLGWWAKQAAGHAVEVVPLPPLKRGTSDVITIASGMLKKNRTIFCERERRHASSRHRSTIRRRLSHIDTSRHHSRHCAKRSQTIVAFVSSTSPALSTWS